MYEFVASYSCGSIGLKANYFFKNLQKKKKGTDEQGRYSFKVNYFIKCIAKSLKLSAALLQRKTWKGNVSLSQPFLHMFVLRIHKRRHFCTQTREEKEKFLEKKEEKIGF